jgi:hypothetical protein
MVPEKFGFFETKRDAATPARKAIKNSDIGPVGGN